MSRSRNPDAAEPGQPGHYRAPAGLLEKLMAAVRPEFRAGDLVFDPRDPVFGGPPCAVNGCGRPHRRQDLCTSHWQRWRGAGGISLAEFTAAAEPGWQGHLPLDSCVIDGCNYGAMGRGMCNRHFSRWYRAGCPDPEHWQAQAPPLAPDGPLRACRIGYCSLWTRGTSVFCYGHDTRWKNNGRPDIDEFTASCENPGPGQEHIDLRRLPAGLRLEMQYVLQCRSDEQDAKLPPREIHPFVAVLAGAGASSLLEQPEEWWTALHPPRKGRGWRPFILDARRRVEALAFGAGWDTEYPRDIWRLCNLGIDKPEATISFAGIPQAWLRELAKRYTRWQLATGLSVSTAGSGARAVTRFAAWLAALPEPARRAGRRDPPAAGTLPGRPAGGNGRPGAPYPLRRRAERFPEGGPPARLGRHAAGYHGDLPGGLPSPRRPASPRPRRPRHGPGRAARQPRQAGQSGLPAASP